MAAVQSAIVRLVTKETGLTDAEVKDALLNSEVKQVVAKHMLNENVQLVDKSGKPVYRRQISSFVTDAGMEEDYEDEHPDLDPADAKIRMQPEMLKDVTEAVAAHNRQQNNANLSLY